MARDVFISYRSEDKAWADRLCDGLERLNITCWIAPRDIAAGREWAEAIVDALQHCKSFVLVLSSHSSNARQISREAELADHQGLPIITFRVEDVQPPSSLVFFLGNRQWLDAFDGKFDSSLARLADAVRTGGSQPAPPPPPPPTVVASNVSVPPTSPTGVSPRNLVLGAVAIVAICLGAWWFSRPAKPAPPVVSEAEASKEAAKFLNALKSSNYDEAWNQYTIQARPGHAKSHMVKIWTEADQKFGPIQSFRINRCAEDDPSGVYTCAIVLEYREGLKAEGSSVVSLSNGVWGISDSRHSEPKKAR